MSLESGVALSRTRHSDLCDLRRLGWVRLLPHAGLAVPDAPNSRQCRHEQEAAEWEADGQAKGGVFLRCCQLAWNDRERRRRRAWRRRGRCQRAVLDLDGTAAWARGARDAVPVADDVLDFGRADDRRAPLGADPHRT